MNLLLFFYIIKSEKEKENKEDNFNLYLNYMDTKFDKWLGKRSIFETILFSISFWVLFYAVAYYIAMIPFR